MAYCKSCGAYIPDGVTACLACGYDEAAEQRKNAGTATVGKHEKTGGAEKYKQFDSDFLKQQLNEQRRRQQENSRKWAETEYAQRQKAKEEQTRNFTNTSGRSTGSDVYRTVRSAMNSDESGKVLAGLSYFSVLFLLPYLFKSDDDFATYHAKQGMTLFAAGVLADIAGGLIGVGWLVALARIYFIFQGIGNVIRGQKKPLPYIGDILK